MIPRDKYKIHKIKYKQRFLKYSKYSKYSNTRNTPNASSSRRRCEPHTRATTTPTRMDTRRTRLTTHWMMTMVTNTAMSRWRLFHLPKLFTSPPTSCASQPFPPRIIGATTLFASGKSDMHLKSKGRWAGDIAYIYARFCPEMDREAVRAMGQTDASPFMECADSHWASLIGMDRRLSRLGRRRGV